MKSRKSAVSESRSTERALRGTITYAPGGSSLLTLIVISFVRRRCGNALRGSKGDDQEKFS